MTDSLARLARTAGALADSRMLVRVRGQISDISQTRLVGDGLARHARLGDHVSISTAAGPCRGQISRVSETSVVIAPFAGAPSVRLGDPVDLEGPFRVRPHVSWKGRLMDPLCEPVDGGGPLEPGRAAVAVDGAAPTPMARRALGERLTTGVKAIDVFAPLCDGQRLGIFAGSGVGKSTLLGMMSRMPGIDTVVAVLVGERGREVREFANDVLGAARANTVMVVATSSDTAMLRQLAPCTGMAIAEHFRDQGERVLLVIDSMTRFAHAMRDFALGADELPIARGYPPSVFGAFGQLLERAGPGEDGRGSITALVTILVDGDDHNDPVADALRGILDGHVVLDRRIAAQGRYPAVDVLASLSRLAPRLLDPEQTALTVRLRRLLSRFEETRDIRLLGGYQPGTDAALDDAVACAPAIYDYLCQGPGDPQDRDPFATLRHLLARSAPPASSSMR